MASLYEIASRYLDILESMEEDASVLDEIKDTLENKIENIGCYIKDITAMAEAIKTEEENLCARRKTLEKKADRLKEYLASCMQMTGVKKYASQRLAVGFRSSKSVTILNEAMIPEDFMVIKTTKAPDKVAIKTAMENGIYIPGAEITKKENIQIK
jgi:Mg2+ and Co2+ transporter CorA